MSSGSFGAGHTLGRYELLVPIAAGGMASVWAARMRGQRGFQKIVAIKRMRPELSGDPNFETMFLDEAGLVSRLKHPNLAEIMDLGEENDELYQVMEYVDGEPLNRLLRQCRSPIPVPLAVRIAKEVCAGLHAAHELRDEDGNLVGLVHRDVSLQNILVTFNGVTKVIDFGVAKAVGNLQKTHVGQVKGKVPYMSPEQGIGDPIDRRTDVFALGIVLYQLTTGKHPFRGDNDLETLMHICDKSPVAPASTLVPGLPPALDRIISKALEKEREDRFETMSEMLRALEMALPPDAQASAEDLGRFMQQHLGERGEKRRQSIQEAGRAADALNGPASEGKLSQPPPLPSTSTPSLSPSSARLSTRSAPPASAPTRPTDPLRITPPPPTVDRTAVGVQTPASAQAQRPSWSQSMAAPGRSAVLGLVAAVAGVGIGVGLFSLTSIDGPTGEALQPLYAALPDVGARLRPPLHAVAEAKGAPDADTMDAGTPDADAKGASPQAAPKAAPSSAPKTTKSQQKQRR